MSDAKPRTSIKRESLEDRKLMYDVMWNVYVYYGVNPIITEERIELHFDNVPSLTSRTNTPTSSAYVGGYIE